LVEEIKSSSSKIAEVEKKVLETSEQSYSGYEDAVKELKEELKNEGYSDE
jgi:uncharacterized protein (DUF302 family)